MSAQKKKSHVKKVKPSENIVKDEVPTTDGGGGDHGCKTNEYWNGEQCVLKVGLNG